jgi:hypothetical protein
MGGLIHHQAFPREIRQQVSSQLLVSPEILLYGLPLSSREHDDFEAIVLAVTGCTCLPLRNDSANPRTAD